MKTIPELIRLVKPMDDPDEAIAALKAEGVDSDETMHEILSHTVERPMDEIPDELYELLTSTWDDKNGDALFVHGTCVDPDDDHIDMMGMDCGGKIAFKDGAWVCTECGEKHFIGKWGKGLEEFVIADYWTM